ncbi:MAG: helix-turn-helix transcriptional regulator [Clostridiales bacterium]|uniref:helix-turn-helix transcriptional regulator n=1 Tax=Caproiciproducens sp. MSJ-32 TaxID=2841527 RepID=UPI0016B8519F|nr:helix-turn-helix transcriptional regulator [Caproiciproducens sp. MSJ-32]MBU5454536.1 helix-turn-helix domain-containing protein [Caproiciproducens sp. MSJ-32]NLK22613.1 helix-turn-helix transcriptional regulator [Clostridiales bacterium]
MKYKIKALRVGQGIKAKDFAKEVGISREYLRLIENGKAKNPSVEIMKRISNLLGVSPLELFFDENEV